MDAKILAARNIGGVMRDLLWGRSDTEWWYGAGGAENFVNLICEAAWRSG